jgi:hypothetical protein
MRISPSGLEELHRRDEVHRQQSQAICDKIKAEAAEKQKKYDIDKAAYLAAVAINQKLQKEQAAKLEADRKEQARQDAMPINRLLTGYRFFHYVSVCNEARSGYLLKYVNDDDLERAHKAVRAIADKASKDDPSINTDNVWKQALQSPIFPRVNDAACRTALVQLVNSSPTILWNVEKP